MAFSLDETSWSGAILLAAIQVGSLFALALILRKKTLQPAVRATTALVLLLLSADGVGQLLVQKAIVTFLFYALFAAFSKEILFRGYMQSRFNEVFSKPYQFFGIMLG